MMHLYNSIYVLFVGGLYGGPNRKNLLGGK